MQSGSDDIRCHFFCRVPELAAFVGPLRARAVPTARNQHEHRMARPLRSRSRQALVPSLSCCLRVVSESLTVPQATLTIGSPYDSHRITI